MITSTYATEQVARFARQDREAAAAAARIAREVRRQRTAPAATPGPRAPQPGSVRIPRQRRWIDALVATVR